MKMFLLFLTLGLAASEKLDRTYLPPPGAKFSGGVPGDIQAPFEFKETPIPQSTFKNGQITPEDTRVEIGINRGLPSQAGVPEDSVYTPGSQTPVDIYKVPTTTTSYAFTQTTTHPPTEGFETTIGPINPVTGLPTINPFIDFQPTGPGFVNNPQNIVQGQQFVPGYQQPGIPGQQPTSGVPQFPGSTTAPTTVSQFGPTRPGFVQTTQNQYQDNQRPSLPGFQRPGGSLTPSQNLAQYEGNQYPGDVYNVGPSGTISPSISSQGTTPNLPFNKFNQVQGTNAPIPNIPFSQGLPSSPPSGQFGDNSQAVPPNANQAQYNVIPGQPGVLQPGLNLPPTQRPTQDQYQLNKEGFIQPGSIQGQLPGQNQYKLRPGSPQQVPTQVDSTGRPLPGQVFSTASPNTPVPGFANQYPTTPGSYPTSGVPYPTEALPPGPSYPGIGQGRLQNGVARRPERPQAEADRNAVILDYQSVITPEGEFSYSFDTSNGIHADESGTAADGVKAKGSYSYIGDDGKLYSVVYTADENGFQPRGDHLPTPPPIPEAIQKVIEQANREKNAGFSDDGTYDEDKYGHKKYQGQQRQKPTPIGIADKDKGKKNVNQYVQADRQDQPIQNGDRKSIISTGQGLNDYDETFEEYEPTNRGEINNANRRRPIGKVPSRRPANRIEEQDQETYTSDGGLIDNANKRKPIGKIPSRRPVVNQDQYDSDLQENDNRRKPFGKIPSRKPVSNEDGSYTFDEKVITDNGDRTRTEVSGPVRRPGGTTLRPYDQYDYGTTYDVGSTNEEMEQNQLQSGGGGDDGKLKTYGRPGIDDYTKRPIVQTSTYKPILKQYAENDEDKDRQNVPGEYNETGKDYDTKTGTFTTRRPVFNKGSTAIERYNQNRRRPQVSTTYPPELESGDRFDDGHMLELDKTGKNQNVKRPIQNRPDEVNIYTTTRPSANQRLDGLDKYENKGLITGQRPGDMTKYTTVQPPAGQEVTYTPQNQTEAEYDVTRASIPGKPGYDQNIRRPVYSQRPEELIKYTTVRPSGQESTIISQIPEQYDSRTTVPGKNSEINQRARRPIYGQRPEQVTQYNTAKPFDEETGYQYIPPQKKFEQNSVPGVLSTQKDYFQRKGEIPRPFTTPDVIRADEAFEDAGDLQEDRKQTPGSISFGPQTGNIYVNRPTANQQQSDVYEKGNGPSYYSTKDMQLGEDDYGNKDITKIPGQPAIANIGSTRRPYQQSQRYQPQGPKQQYRPGAEYQESLRIPSGNIRPSQKNDGYFVDKNGDETFVSSTTPVPSQNGQFEVTQASRRPAQQSTDRFVDSQSLNPQGFDFVSTTKMPPQSQFGTQYSEDIYKQTPTQAPYQTTYLPMTTISSNLNSDKGVPGSVSSSYQVSNNRPGYSQNQVPSTTYRPGYFSTEGMNIEGAPAVDNYGRPIAVDQSQRLDGTTRRPGYTGDVTNVGFPSSSQEFGGRQPSVQFTDGKDTASGVNKYRKPLPPGQDQGFSTTEKIIGEDFSGPKQQQRFDPERGYYY